MEWLHWFQAHIAQVISALAGLGIVGAILNLDALLRALVSVGSMAQALWRWICGKRAGSDIPLATSAHQTQHIYNEQASVIDSQQVTGNHNMTAGTMTFSQTINNNHYWRRERRQQRKALKSKARRSPRPPKQGRRKPVGDATPRADLRVQDIEPMVPDFAPTPEDTLTRTEGEGGSIIESPLAATNSTAELIHDATSVIDGSALIEAEPTGREVPSTEGDQTGISTLLDPISDEGANVVANDFTSAGLDSNITPIEPTIPLGERNMSSANAQDDADRPTLGESVDVSDEAAAQAGVEEAIESPHNQASLIGQPTIENLDPESQRNANADATTSISEATSVFQLTILPDEREAVSPLSDVQAGEAENVDRDIADIANNWPAPAISEALKRLRQARGLLPTDLSYDAGWITAFEAGRWHTYQSERQCYISGIRIYLHALGMTPAELKGYLPPLMSYQNGT